MWERINRFSFLTKGKRANGKYGVIWGEFRVETIVGREENARIQMFKICFKQEDVSKEHFWRTSEFRCLCKGLIQAGCPVLVVA